jgi:metal-responsive CopG/Arc/MetJ family transcriptional regulator
VSSVRLNITIPEEVARQLDRIVGARGKSRFIAEALTKRIQEIEEQKLHQMLEEGYKARKRESQSIAREFEPAGLEGWDEY